MILWHRLRCYFGKHKWELVKIPLMFTDEGEKHIDFKCLWCGKLKEGVGFWDGFHFRFYTRLLTEEEKEFFRKNPYCFIKKINSTRS